MGEKGYKFKGTGLQTAQRNQGKQQFAEYLRIYPHLNKISLLTLLEELIFLELINESIKIKIGQLSKVKSVKSSSAVPSHLLKELQSNLSEILKLKTELGMFEDKDKISAFTDLENLKKKAKAYRQNHPLSYKTTCPFCSEIYFMKRKTENYEPHISPFFENKILVNRPLFELYHQEKINKKEIAEVLGVAEDYINWVEEKILNTKKSS